MEDGGVREEQAVPNRRAVSRGEERSHHPFPAAAAAC